MTPEPTSPTNGTRVSVADILDRPGASRRVELALPVPEGLDLPLAEVIAPVRLAGVLESVVDGVLVRGELSTRVRLSCARCLRELEAEVLSDVTELFTAVEDIEPGDELDEGYEIADTHLDLDTLVRDALVPAVPSRPLCDAACAGLCPTCGADRNETTCSCAETAADPRWGALEGLHLPDGDQ